MNLTTALQSTVPSHDLDTERALLGCFLLWPDKRHEVTVLPEHLYDREHRILLAAIDVVNQTVSDVPAVHAAYKAQGGSWGAAQFFEIAELAGVLPAALLARLEDLRQRRQARVLAVRLAEAAENPTHPLTEQAPGIADQLRSIVGSTSPPRAGMLLADVKGERVTWLWDRRLPCGKVALLEGDPDEGKSCIAIDLAARVTTGKAMPFDPSTREPAGVVFLTAEDGLGDTVRPRFEGAGANLERVVVFRPEELPTIGTSAGCERIEAAISQVGARLVVVDPLMALLADKVESYKDHDIRRALAPLAALAQRTGAAVLVIRHLNKSGSANAKHRGGGSIGILGAARSALLVAQDPDNPDRKVLARVKGNLAPPAPSVAYRLVANGESVRVKWIEETGHTANALLAAALEAERPGKLETAADFLLRFLSDGKRLATDVKNAAEREGIAGKTLQRARERLGMTSQKDGFSGAWYWALPAEDGQGGQDDHGPMDDHLRGGWPPSDSDLEEGDLI